MAKIARKRESCAALRNIAIFWWDYQAYTIATFWDIDECFTFWSPKIKDRDLGEINCAAKGTFRVC